MFVYNNPLLYLHDHYYPVESIIYIYYIMYMFMTYLLPFYYFLSSMYFSFDSNCTILLLLLFE